eukprot:s397_g47.t1
MEAVGDHFAKPSGLFPEMNPQPSTLPLKTISHSRRASTTNTTDFIRKVTNGSIHRAPSRRPSLSEGRVAVRGFTWPTNPGCGASDSSWGFFRALAVDVLTAAQRRSRRSGMCSNLRRTGKSLLMHRQPGCCFVAADGLPIRNSVKHFESHLEKISTLVTQAEASWCQSDGRPCKD